MAGNCNLGCDQYATFNLTITWTDSQATPINLTGFTAISDVKALTSTNVINFSNLISANGNSASPVVSSTSRAFFSADVGSTLVITSGTNWLAGSYSIVSVSSGTATLDRACGSAAGLSGGTGTLNGTLLYQFSTSAGTITLGGSSGTITMTIPSATTFTFNNGVYSWDILLISAGNVATRLLQGQFTVAGGITTGIL